MLKNHKALDSSSHGGSQTVVEKNNQFQIWDRAYRAWYFNQIVDPRFQESSPKRSKSLDLQTQYFGSQVVPFSLLLIRKKKMTLEKRSDNYVFLKKPIQYLYASFSPSDIIGHLMGNEGFTLH